MDNLGVLDGRRTYGRERMDLCKVRRAGHLHDHRMEHRADYVATPPRHETSRVKDVNNVCCWATHSLLRVGLVYRDLPHTRFSAFHGIALMFKFLMNS